MKGLIIKKKWLDLIFTGTKTIEVRGNNTKMRGKILLIESGSGEIKGECVLTDSKFLTLEDYNNCPDHCIDTLEIPYPYTKTYGWELQEVTKYPVAIPYKHPQGAVIWVNI